MKTREDLENEIWKPIAGFEGRYEISSYGRFRNMDGDLLRLGHSGGYFQCCLFKEKKRKFVVAHRLVAIAFIPNPENKPFVNHKDGDKLNNHISNLEWVTRSENEKHAYRTGLKNQKGERNGCAKLTNNEALLIASLKGERSAIEIGKMFGVSYGAVNNIHSGRSWGHVTNIKRKS